MPKGEAMFEICLVFASGRSSLFRRDSLIDARETAREAASVTGNKVEIVDRQTGDVVERHEPPKLPELGRRSALDRMASEEPRQRETAAQAQELRRKAALARQAARIPAAGSKRVDRVLVVLAAQLERDALLLEEE
jgi:hypothetical protein